jgi:hypothetical protein
MLQTVERLLQTHCCPRTLYPNYGRLGSGIFYGTLNNLHIGRRARAGLIPWTGERTPP